MPTAPFHPVLTHSVFIYLLGSEFQAAHARLSYEEVPTGFWCGSSRHPSPDLLGPELWETLGDTPFPLDLKGTS